MKSRATMMYGWQRFGRDFGLNRRLRLLFVFLYFHGDGREISQVQQRVESASHQFRHIRRGVVNALEFPFNQGAVSIRWHILYGEQVSVSFPNRLCHYTPSPSSIPVFVVAVRGRAIGSEKPQ